ncbi:MAG: hypothetical protein J0H14_07090 [Alphaproteobacteria bacterium]|nr:hypothetical protein [Alphaproteobacteria bacterium]
MPNLEQHTVTVWLTELRPAPAAAEWPPAIRAVETWDEMPRRLVELGAALDDVARSDLETLANALRHGALGDDLMVVMAQLGAARIMRLLHWLSEIDLPECHAVITALLKDDGGSGRALRAAVAAVTRQATLRRIFAPERIAALEAACTETFKEVA